MNSFTFIGRGIDAAVRDQIALYDQGATVEQHTYDYEPHSDRLTPHRAKEEADDYRYFPEPDLVPLRPERETVERLRDELPELPGHRIVRLRDEVGAATAQTLVTGGLDALWAATRDAGADPIAAANVIANQLVGAGVDPERVSASELAKLVSARDEIPRTTFDDAIGHAGDEGFSADPYLEQKAVADTSQLEPIVDDVLAANASQVAAYRGGKAGLLGFFVGQVMKATNGQADARVVNDLVRKKLEA
jgi:aspartyl-tRNA(Asn)/glutamyl-tRNA(Gln) amidotransferase subunit B